MKQLLIIILGFELFCKLEGMHHLLIQPNCTHCIIRLLEEKKNLVAFRLLSMFDSDVYDISTAQGTEASLLHFYVKQADIQKYFLNKILAKGGKLELRDPTTGETPLLVALRYCNLAAVKLLVDAGANTNLACYTNQKTPLHLLCLNGNSLRKRSDCQQLVKKILGLSTISLKELAIRKISSIIISSQRFLMLPSELKVEISFGRLQQHKSFDLSQLDLLNLYELELFKERIVNGLDREAAINKKDIQGNTPLHIAARAHSFSDFICFLVQSGADRLITNNAGQTPLQMVQQTACDNKHCCGVLKIYLNQPRLVLEKIEEKLNKIGSGKK